MFWDNYFKGHNEKPSQLFSTVAELVQNKKFKDTEAAIKKYLLYQSKQAEPWMYELLVKTIEDRKGPESEIKKAISFAAMLAKRTKNPKDLIRIADMMVIRNFYGPVGDPAYETNIGELIDMAAAQEPANIYPPMMSVNLANKTKDPKRMAAAADQLLSLGWPGFDGRVVFDEKVRRDLAQQVELLEKALQADGKPAEAESLTKEVAESQVRDLYISLKWTGEADIDLIVEEPLGATAEYKNPRTVFGGAILKNGYGKNPEEIYVCPRGFDGDYTIRVDAIYNDEAKPVKEATLTIITHEGGADEKRQETKVSLDSAATVKVRLAGGRRKEVLPFIAPLRAPEMLVKDSNVAKAKPNSPAAAPAKPAKKDGKPVPIR